METTFKKPGSSRSQVKLAGVQIPVLEDMSFALPGMSAGIRVEPTQKRIRTFIGDTPVADTTRAVICFQNGRLPVYYLPVDDVRMELLAPTGKVVHSEYKGDAVYFRICADGRIVEDAAWRYRDCPVDCPDLSEYMAFHWKLMDAWCEEDEEVFVHLRDPYHRIDVLRCGRRVEVSVGGQVIADTHHSRMLFETSLPARYYVPRECVRFDLLQPSTTRTACAYKGVTSDYWAADVNGALLDIAWSYADPEPEVGKIAGLVSFFNERVDIRVDGELQTRPSSPWS